MFNGFFSSVKLAIVLLVSLATTSILGTIIPQNGNCNDYLNAYGYVFYQIFDFFGLFDMYHSWWFQLMLFLLCVNIFFCTLKRFSGTWKFVFVKNISATKKLRKLSRELQFSCKQNFEVASEFCSSVVLREFRHCSTTKFSDGIVINADSGKWTRFSVHIIHFSVVLLLLGGLLSSMLGFEGYVNVTEGETVNFIKLKETGKIYPLDFAIRCDKFEAEFYENGVPKEYRSKLTIMKNGGAVTEKYIRVNDPMSFNGVNIFQSSYGRIPTATKNNLFLPERFEINFTSKISGVTYTKKLTLGVFVTLPEKLGQFRVLDYLPSVSFNGVDIGPSFKCEHKSVDSEISEEVLLPLDFPNFDLMRGSVFVVSLSERLSRDINFKNNEHSLYYTGLLVTKDPGKYVVYAGFSFMLFGFLIVFLMFHKEIYVKIEKNDIGGSKIILRGYTNRSKLTTENMIEKIHNHILSANSFSK